MAAKAWRSRVVAGSLVGFLNLDPQFLDLFFVDEGCGVTAILDSALSRSVHYYFRYRPDFALDMLAASRTVATVGVFSALMCSAEA